MSKRQAFLIMMSQEEIIEDLTDEELGKIFRSIFKYEKNKEIPKFNDRYLNSVFKSFKAQLDFSEENYNKICEKNRQNINKRWNKDEYERIQSNTDVYERNVSYTKNTNIREDNIREDNIRKDKRREDNNRVADATPDSTPIFTFTEILEYGQKKGADEKYCKKFFDYYEEKKWMSGRTKIKDWKSKFDEWIEEDQVETNFYELKKIGEGVFKL